MNESEACDEMILPALKSNDHLRKHLGVRSILLDFNFITGIYRVGSLLLHSARFANP